MRSSVKPIDTSEAIIEARRSTKEYIQLFHGFLSHEARAETAYLNKQQLRLLRELMYVKGQDRFFHFKGADLRRLLRREHFDCLIEGCFFPEGYLNHYLINAIKSLRENKVPYRVSLTLLYEQSCFSLAKIKLKIEQIKAQHKISDYFAFSFYLLEGKPNHQRLFLELLRKRQLNSLGLIYDLSEAELSSFDDLIDDGYHVVAAHALVMQERKIEAQVETIIADIDSPVEAIETVDDQVEIEGGSDNSREVSLLM